MQRILAFATIAAYCLAMDPNIIPVTIQYLNTPDKRFQFNWYCQYPQNTLNALKEEISRQMDVNQGINPDYWINPYQQQIDI